MKSATKACLIIMIAFAAEGTSQVETILDLTTPEIRQLDETRTAGCGSRGGGVVTSGGVVPDPEVPLSLQLESLNQTDYKTGDEVVGVVRLTNVGSKPVIIPWNPDSEAVFGKKCEWPYKSLGATGLKASVSLLFTDEGGHNEFIASHGLYGVSKRPKTYRTLAPGQSAVVKIRGSVHFDYIIEKRREKGLEFKLPQEFAVSGSFDLDDSSLLFPYKTVRSKNEIRVRIDESGR